MATPVGKIIGMPLGDPIAMTRATCPQTILTMAGRRRALASIDPGGLINGRLMRDSMTREVVVDIPPTDRTMAGPREIVEKAPRTCEETLVGTSGPQKTKTNLGKTHHDHGKPTAHDTQKTVLGNLLLHGSQAVEVVRGSETRGQIKIRIIIRTGRGRRTRSKSAIGGRTTAS